MGPPVATGAPRRDLAAGPELSDALVADLATLDGVLESVIAEQHGPATLALVRSVQELGRDARTGLDARDELVALVESCSIHDALTIIRAFSYRALLTNIAEDVDRDRERRAGRTRADPPPRSIAAAVRTLRDGGGAADEVAALVRRTSVSPVLTAHPTEVRRKTVFDTQRAVDRLLRDRPVEPSAPWAADDGAEGSWELDLHREVLALWQTAILRLTKLRVRDEINETLRYYALSLSEVVPALHRRLARELRAAWPDLPGEPGGSSPGTAPPVIRMGSWIGGDRDGNPFVTAALLRYALDRHAFEALAHHLGELDQLGLELSMSSRLVTPTDDVQALADASLDDSPFRRDEPYRRALRGMYARLSSTAVALVGSQPGREPHAELPAYATSDDLLSDLAAVDRSLRTHGAGLLADGRLRRLRGAVERSASTSARSTSVRARRCTRTSSTSSCGSPA